MNEIKISNFRGIKNLFVKETKLFNLIAGKNNCGKTTVLEAIYAAASIPRISLHLLNDIRVLKTNGNDDFNSLFFNTDKSLDIKVEIENENLNRSVTIKSRTSGTDFPLSYQELQKKGYSVCVKNNDYDYSVSMNYDKINTNQQIIMNEDIVKIQKDMPVVPVFLWGAQWENFNFSQYLEKLIVAKKIASVISLLKKIEPSVQNIQLGNEEKIYIDTGIKNLFPVQVMGAGFVKALGLISIISTLHDGIILIDEFENGLHFSAMDILWKGVVEACKKNNVILFATTHSYECIQSFFENTEQEQSVLFRIEKKSNEHSVFSISKDNANIAFEENWEIR